MELTANVASANKQVKQYRERVQFLESMESAQKKELEEHVDVLLKMEQERVLLLKESQTLKDSKLQLET